jgi:hypothetical protein
MTRIWIETEISATPERCFDAACDIDLHLASNADTRERAVAVAGVTRGLIGPEGWVTWQAVHFGLRHTMTMRIADYERPRRFVDEMVEGPFQSIKHAHEFAERDGKTVMTDDFAYQVPFGLLGWVFDRLVLESHMQRLVRNRASFLKRAIEKGAVKESAAAKDAVDAQAGSNNAARAEATGSR